MDGLESLGQLSRDNQLPLAIQTSNRLDRIQQSPRGFIKNQGASFIHQLGQAIIPSLLLGGQEAFEGETVRR